MGSILSTRARTAPSSSQKTRKHEQDLLRNSYLPTLTVPAINSIRRRTKHYNRNITSREEEGKYHDFLFRPETPHAAIRIQKAWKEKIERDSRRRAAVSIQPVRHGIDQQLGCCVTKWRADKHFAHAQALEDNESRYRPTAPGTFG